MLKGKEAVIFDLDGTITDSMWVWDEIDREFFDERNMDIPDTLQKKIDGMSFTQTARYFIDAFSLDIGVEELKEIWNNKAVEKYRSKTPLKAGITDLLRLLRKKGMALGIATSNSRKLVDVFLEARNLAGYFDVVTTGDEVKIGKPEPDVYLYTAKKLGVSPEKCLVFEDIPFGLIAGKRAGMEVCGIDDTHSADMREEKRALSDYYITDFTQVLDNTYEVLR